MAGGGEVNFGLLVSVLEEMIRQQVDFLLLLQREAKLIVAADIKGLTECQKAKERFLDAFNLLEERREGVMVGVSRMEKGKTLSQWIASAPYMYQGRLRLCQERLIAITRDVIRVNQTNGLMVEKSLRQVVGLLTLLKDSSEPSVTYKATGYLDASFRYGKVIGIA